jgi:uncharacterized surface protein with fasciclin (FAS1) repeats
MKTTYKIGAVFFILLVINACGPASQTSGSSSSSNEIEYTKGQSSVSDELSEKNILHVAIGSKDHTTLVAAVQAVEMEDVLSNAGPLTVFAPTNAAFDALPAGTVENLLKPENKQTLARIIKFHASPGNYKGDMLRDNMNLYQASGHYIKVKRNGDQVTIDGANILGTVEASNGVVHVIDKVLLPPDKS